MTTKKQRAKPPGDYLEGIEEMLTEGRSREDIEAVKGALHVIVRLLSLEIEYSPKPDMLAELKRTKILLALFRKALKELEDKKV